VNLSLAAPSAPVTVGSTFTVPVVLTGGADIASIPMQVQFDADKLALVNVDLGDLLGRDGQAASISHREDGGLTTINASRPPGAAGVSGATPGTVCVLSFQAKAAGSADIAIVRPGALTSKQQPLLAQGGHISIQVQ
jgi:general secretion pathway protein D